ncbi:MAG TPA: ABC transporter permease, partial [Vicinamibacteria bacterium]|nr:ABC transporter permease [Vicinamibacteria bacterium]
MSPQELLREALRALRANALRSGLTLLGIIIGVGTLVGVVSVITGLDAFVSEKIIRLAPDVY